MFGAGAPAAGGGGGDLVDINLSAYDFSQVADSNFAVLDPGFTYEAVVEKVEGKRAKNDGSEMIKVTLAVTYPETGARGEKFKNAKLFDYMSLKPDAQWRIKSFLAACESLGADGRFSGQSIQDLVGYVVRFRIKNEEWNGAPTNKVNGAYSLAFESPGLQGGAPAPVAPVGYPAAPAGAPTLPGYPGAYPQAGVAPAPPAADPYPGYRADPATGQWVAVAPAVPVAAPAPAPAASPYPGWQQDAAGQWVQVPTAAPAWPQ